MRDASISESARTLSSIKADLDRLPGIKERELAQHGACPICRKPLLNGGGLPFFYRVTVERAGFRAEAIQRRAGLEMVLGSGPLAQAMGPDEDLAKVFEGPATVVVHEDCASRVGHLLALMPKECGE